MDGSARPPIALDHEVLHEVARRAAAAGVEPSAYVNVVLRRHLRLATAQPGVADLETARDGYLQALLDRDAARARESVDALLAAGVPVAEIYAGVLAPALREVGHMWALDELNVAQEHYATSVTQSVIAALSAEAPATDGQGRLAVVTSTPDELHLLGAQMVADLLQREGWEVLNLGAATPAGDLVALVADECPDLVALSATTAGRLPGVSETIERLAGMDPRPLIVAGGGLFSGQAAGLARELGADLVLTDVRDLLAELPKRFPPLA